MDFLKLYNPSISWLDCHVGMPYLAANGAVCQSSAKDVAKSMACSDQLCMSKCSIGVLCKNQVVTVASQVAESIKVNIVFAKMLINLVHGDPESWTWCMLVWPVVSQATGQNGVKAQYAQLCDKFQDAFHDEPGLPPRRGMDHTIDLIDELLPPPKHRQY